jgi:hypothetical protein
VEKRTPFCALFRGALEKTDPYSGSPIWLSCHFHHVVSQMEKVAALSSDLREGIEAPLGPF